MSYELCSLPSSLSVQVCEGVARHISLLVISVYQQSASQGLFAIELVTCIYDAIRRCRNTFSFEILVSCCIIEFCSVCTILNPSTISLVTSILSPTVLIPLIFLIQMLYDGEKMIHVNY